jgi:isoleucyl-tRNA synthetase
VVAQLSAPVAPFFMDKLFLDLDKVTQRKKVESVHLSDYPSVNSKEVDTDLEQRMAIAQQISSMVLSLRKKSKLKVRQPLQKIIIPILNEQFKTQILAVEDLILSEVNVKEMELLSADSGIFVKSIKANFSTLGPKYGKFMKGIAAALQSFTAQDIQTIESTGKYVLDIQGEKLEIELSDVEILTQDIPGWLVANEGKYTVALDVTLTQELKEEGIARELVNKIQGMRKDSDYELTDKIEIFIEKNTQIDNAILNFKNYICTETLANKIELVENIQTQSLNVEVEDGVFTNISITKLN